MTSRNRYRPVANWRDAAAYPRDVSDLYSADVVRAYSAASKLLLGNMMWRWEFLRRHPEYQRKWNKPSGKSGRIFGLAVPSPDPFRPDRNIPLIFGDASGERVADTLTAVIDLRYPAKDQLAILQQRYVQVHRVLKSKLSSAIYKRKYGHKWPQKRDIVRALRVLDAYADGASFGEIARVTGKNIPPESRSEYGRRYVQQALAMQALFTRLPEQTLT